MDEQEKRLRKAIDDLHCYTREPKNSLTSTVFLKLLDELYLARGAMVGDLTSDSEIAV